MSKTTPVQSRDTKARSNARSATCDRFLAGRTITGVDHGNRLLAQFIAEIAHVRPHPTIAQRTVGKAFAIERPRLLALPEPLPETARIEPIKADSQAFIHLDTNRYSVPSDYARHRAIPPW